MKKLILSTFLLVVVQSSFAADLVEKPSYCKYLKCKVEDAYVCGSLTIQKRELKYCYLSPTGFEKSQKLWTQIQFDRTKVIRPLVHFHGAGASDLSKWWNTFYQLTWSQLEEKGNAPLPILVSFGPAWLLSRDSRFFSVHDFMNHALPTIIAKIRAQEPSLQLEERVAVLGESMGGHNSLQVYLNYPDRISNVAVFCSAVIELSPFATEQEILAYIKRTGAVPNVARAIPVIAKDSYANEEHYLRDNLLNLVRPNTPYVPLWVNYDDGDEFGFDKTNPSLLELLAEVNAPVTLSHAPGRHCEGSTTLLKTAYSFLNK